MAWSKTLLDASFRGIVFDILAVQDEAERALSRHGYPYVNGEEIEDLGEGARRIGVRAIFSGDDYETALKQFIAALEQPGAGELVHPVFGSFTTAQVARWRIEHEADNVDQAEVSVEFEISTPSVALFSGSAPSSATQKINPVLAQARTDGGFSLSKIITRLRALNPSATLSDLRATLLGPLSSMRTLVSGVAVSGMDVVNFPLSFVSDLTALGHGVLNLRSFAPGNLMGDFKASLASLSSVFGVSYRIPGPQPRSAVSVATPLTAVNAAGAPLALPGRLSADQPNEAQAVDAAHAHLLLEHALLRTEAAQTVLTAEFYAPTLTSADIEYVAEQARVGLEVAIQTYRALYPLELARPVIEDCKTVALAVQDMAAAIIVSRPPLVARRVDAPGNLRLIAHRWYGDHNRADELLRLNDLRLPNFVQAGEVLNGYSA